MTSLVEKLQASTSKGALEAASLILADGTAFSGYSCGAPGKAIGEVCFNTSVEGYLEVISDPSYAGQIVVMTYPQIGNYGVSESDVQSGSCALRGLVIRDLCRTPSNWRSTMTLQDYLLAQGIVAIEGVDTRALVRHIRDKGAQLGCIITGIADSEQIARELADAPSLSSQNLVAQVAPTTPMSYGDVLANVEEGFALKDPESTHHKVIAYDCGAKASILDGLRRVGCDLTVVPWDTPAEEVLAAQPDGVFISNGPGDPDIVTDTYEQVEKLLGKVPLFGICLGHQMICKAAGATMFKLPFGHHGGNHPVKNLLTGRVEITAQNHGFNLSFESLGPLVPELSGDVTAHPEDLRTWASLGIAPVVQNPRFGRIRLTHINLNDGSAEGISFLDLPAFSVQYHPEAHPGPTDSHYLFTAFSQLMDERSDYLAIDIAKDRLEGWRF